MQRDLSKTGLLFVHVLAAGQVLEIQAAVWHEATPSERKERLDQESIPPGSTRLK